MKKMLIAFDGLDGSGKNTQTHLLTDYLEKQGIPYRYVTFPTYDDTYSFFVNKYLSGEFGENPDDINGYAASAFFAADRYLSFIMDWKKDYDEGKIIIANRYTTANAVHQCSKIPKEKRDGFLEWLFDYEWKKLGLPTPDKVIYLCQPPEVSFSLIQKRCDETGAKKDIHEKDADHLYKSYEAALYVSEKYGWDRIDVSDGVSLRTREDIHREVIQKVSDLLSAKE